MNRLSIFSLLTVIVLLFSGCVGVYEIKHQSFITAMAIQLEDDELLKVSVLELLTEPLEIISEDGSEASGNIRNRIITVTCEQFPNCMEKIREKLSTRFVLDKMKFIIFHESILEAGVEQILEYFFQIGIVELTAFLFSTSQDGEELLANERGTTLTRVISGRQFHPDIFPVNIWEFSPWLYSDLKSNVLTSLSVQKRKDGEIDQEVLHIEGLKFLQKDKLAYSLPADNQRWIHLFFNKNRHDLTYLLKDDSLVYKVRKQRMKVKISEHVVHVNIAVVGWLLIDQKELNVKNEKLEKIVEKEMEERLQKIIDETKENGVDLLGIGEKYRVKNWDTENWQEKIKQLDIRVEVDAQVLSGFGMD